MCLHSNDKHEKTYFIMFKIINNLIDKNKKIINLDVPLGN
jgi:hypothetical protein